MIGRTGRTYTLLIGIAAAGALIWVATRVGETSDWRYWAVLGLLAGAGLAFALTQRTAYGAWSEVTPLGFLVAFVVAAICIVWIAAVGQPHPNWLRDHVSSWSSDLGIRGFVDRMTTYATVMAFGFGALLASAPGALRRRAPTTRTGPAPAAYRRPTGPPATEGDTTLVTSRDRVRV
jgi:hypothetical protein